MTTEDPGTASDERMTDFEAVMWILDGDPRLSSAFANLTILDRAPDRNQLRARMEAATTAVPRLRHRVVEDGGPLATPAWREDPDFDLDRHIRWMDLGSDDLDSVVAGLAGHPFDRDRPLWEFVVIEGLDDGRAAMVQRFDHTITDGEGGIRLSTQFLDLERDPPPRASEDRTSDTDRGRTGSEPEPEEVADDGIGALWWPFHGLKNLADDTAAAIRTVSGIPARTAEILDTALDAVQQLAVDGRRSPLWTDRSIEHWFGRSALDLAQVKDAAHALGGSVNDLFVTGAIEGASRVHRSAGLDVDQLRVAIPVSTRQRGTSGGNSFNPSHTLLPAGDMPIEERFAAVHERLGRVKETQRGVSLEGAVSAVRLMPAPALIGLAGRTAGAIDFVCSNVRAAPFDLYIAGAKLLSNYPLGPLVNTAFNLTTMSYRGWLFLGLVADPVAVPDPSALLEAIDESYTELLAAGGVGERRQPEPLP